MTHSYFKALFMGGFLSLSFLNTSAQLIINEFMQSNIDCIMDDLNDFPDSWVELYNTSSSPVNLGEYSIGIKDKVKKAYPLPSIEISPNDYVLIYCDKVSYGLHTDFRLESGKDGEIYLFKDGDIVESLVDIKKMPAPNIAYGRESDASDVWGYQLTPTPGKENKGGITDLVLPDPIFNISGGVITEPVEITITLPEIAPEASVIRFTTDCSEPTAESPVFEQPLQVDTTTIVRAKVFCAGGLSPRSLTQSYIFHHADMTIPIVSIVTDSVHFYDEYTGIFSDGPEDAEKENWLYEWRRPVNLEYFTSPQQSSEINQLCETRLKGSKSRYYNVKSMVIYANKRFGKKRFENEFFPSQRPGVTDFKSLELRNAGQDFHRMYMRDALVQRTMGEHVDIDWQAYQPVVVYLNGHYYAMLNLRERANEDNIYTHFDGLEDIDMIENLYEVKEGSIDNFNAFKQFYSEDNHTYKEFCEWIDMDEFINYFIMQVYFANCDFPGNNNIMWRPLEEGGKWRWLCKDLDLTLGFATKYDFNYFDWMYHPENYPDKNWATNEETTRMFRALLDLQEFVEEFTSRFALYMGDFMNGDRIVNQLNEMAKVIETEYAYNDAKNIQNEYTFQHYLNLTIAAIKNRNEFLYPYLGEWFDLGNPVPVVIKCEEGISSELYLNGLALSASSFDGALYPDTVLKLSITQADTQEKTFIHVAVTDSDNIVTLSSNESDNLSMPLPVDGKVYILISRDETFNYNDDSSVSEIGLYPDFNLSIPYDIFTLEGHKIVGQSLQNLPKATYILRQGSYSYKYHKTR